MAYGIIRKRMIRRKTKPTTISIAMINRLKQHAKLHKGGMESKHMKNMIKAIKKGSSFSNAHKEALKLNKKKVSK